MRFFLGRYFLKETSIDYNLRKIMILYLCERVCDMETKYKTFLILEFVLMVLVLLFTSIGCERKLGKLPEKATPAESAEQTQSLSEVALAGAEAEELGVIIERNVPVPMRDGTILRADVHRPDRGGPYPVLVQRTQYGKSGNFGRFVKAGYIVVSQDVRGRYESEGQYESSFAPFVYDAEDGYDTVEWAARLPRSNGKVGTFGASDLGGRQWTLAPLRPPSLTAMSANCSIARNTDITQGTFPPFWLGAEQQQSPETRRRANRPGVHTVWEARRLWKEDSGKWINWLPWLELPREVFEDQTEAIRHVMINPHIDTLQLDEGCKDINIPNLFIYGWYDFTLGDILLFQKMIKEAKTEVARRGSRIIVGPWSHGDPRRSIWKVDFGPNAVLDKIAVQIRWFDYWLKGKQNGVDKDAPVKIFVMGDNIWRDEQYWPLERTKERILYIISDGHANTPSGDGELVEKEPASSDTDRYTYDPKHPVPSLYWGRMGPTDQRRLANRQDILVYQTEPLTERIEVTGSPVVELYASSSAPDTDWFVRLIDVYPDGLALDVSHGFLRARYRNGLDKPKLIKPGAIVKYTILMRPTSNAFLPGHRIRLDITSSDFPDYDRHHNTAANQNADATLLTARQTIFHGGGQATRIILPWAPNPIEEENAEEEKPERALGKQMHPFYQAAADGDIERVKLFLSSGTDVNAQDEKGNTPLRHAVESGKMEIVQLLVEAGADVNTGLRPRLSMAVREDDIAIAKYLITHGADVNAGRPLVDAPYSSSIEMIQLLIAKGADVNAGSWTALHSAAEEGRNDIAELLIQKGADINAKNNRGRTPLYIAASANRIKTVELLITKGADINARDHRGRTPLYIAASANRIKTVELLITKGADINAKDNRGRTPLYIAASADRIETVELLITARADINAKANNGMTPVSDALFSNRKDIAGLLIAKGAVLVSIDERGLTALHNAVVEDYPDIVELLLDKGAKVDEREETYEFTALHYAARFGRKNVAEVLIANGANIKAKDKWAYQPIHWAAYHDRADVVELLISKGADVNAKTSLGQTPLQLAKPRRNTAVIEVLRKHGAKE
jgi:putative CocE/NonD family hydrolase